MTDTVRFEGPPPTARPGPKIGANIAKQLQERPGEWGIVKVFKNPSSSRSAAWRMANGVESAFQPSGSFQTVARNVDGEYRVYARYVGTDGDHT